MAEHDWRPLGKVDPKSLTAARLTAHHAVQWVTRAARASLGAAPDDSHSNLGWDAANDALESQPLSDGADAMRIGLRIADLTLVVIGSSGITSELPLDGKTDGDAGAWVDEVLKSLGGNGAARSIDLPYDMPERPVGDRGNYGVETHRAALEELANWISNADGALQIIRSEQTEYQPGPSPVRCWPHHFDIAMLLSLEDGDPETARAIGIGLSPGDETYDQPYLYVNPWPHPSAENLPTLAAPGFWHTTGFVGAIAKGDDIAGLENQRAGTLDFLRVAVASGKSLLGMS